MYISVVTGLIVNTKIEEYWAMICGTFTFTNFVKTSCNVNMF